VIPAREAQPGRIYRLTRDPGSWYYKICDGPTARRLEKRLRGLSVKYMTPEDRFALQAIDRCRDEEHVLAMRALRFRDEQDEPHETKAYVAFPPEYMIREVEKPPGYGPRRGPPRPGRGAEKTEDADADTEVPVEGGEGSLGGGPEGGEAGHENEAEAGDD
jgi:hypothetical protein